MNRKNARLRDLPGPAGSSEKRDGVSHVDNEGASRKAIENSFQSVEFNLNAVCAVFSSS